MRITSLAVAAALSAGTGLAAELPLDKRVFEIDGKKLPYRLLKPLNYNPKQKYPLVVLLHGAGERGTDNGKQLVHGVPEFVKRQREYPCFLIAPQCPEGKFWNLGDEGSGLKLVLDLVESLQKEFGIDGKRLYITGLSMGGFGTWNIIEQHPDLFAAAVPICGGGNDKLADKLTKLPIWCFHGAKDTTVPTDRSRTMIEAIKKAGGMPKYTEYPNEGHASWVPAYKDPALYKWLFSQKRE